MKMIAIDEKKCIRCLKCAGVCPAGIISVKDGKPQVSPEAFCFQCMHCGAACPQEAISFSGEACIAKEQQKNLPENFAGDLKNHLLARRSYRHFSPRQVEEDIIREALAIAKWAPSAKNQHPTRWLVVQGKENTERIMGYILDFVKETGISPEIAAKYEEKGLNLVMGNAGTLILAYASVKTINPAVDTAAAVYSAELYLQAKGIGTCWAGYLTRMSNAVPSLREFFDLPEDHQFYAALMAGYPENEKYIHIPQRQEKGEITWMK